MTELNTPPEFAARRGRGRPKGSPNKVQQAAKDMIAAVAQGLGGKDRMLAWAKEDPLNERAFWVSVYPKMLPLTVAGDDKHPLSVIVRKVIDPASP
jgi:hypothetical protein